MRSVRLAAALALIVIGAAAAQAQYKSFEPGQVWKDTDGVHINAHGGGIIFHEGTYYWFGEHKAADSNSALVGVTCYSSDDLYNWKNEGVVLPVSKDPDSPITKGSIIERPKVIYNKNTRQFVMYFHLELKDMGYEAAYAGMAVSDNATGPYRFIKASRVNPGYWPEGMSEEDKRLRRQMNESHYEWWTPEWTDAVRKGLFIQRDLIGGQMSRDMALFVDDDGKAFHIYSSEENLTLHIAELSDDYTNHTGRYTRIAPTGHNEAPAIFKKDGKYYMITSGCTGWAPNAARLMVADEIMGEWTQHPNPCVGEDAELTFHSQSTYIIPVEGKKDAFIFMGDRWTPNNPIDGRYIWLPIIFRDGLPVLEWHDRWDLGML